jgi:uncharacterized membrane protein YdjX (TVP38/TMEM64 family)
MPRRVLGMLAVLILASAAAGWTVRRHLGVELSTESLQVVVDGMGWKAPALFVGLLTFRQFLLLPAIVILPVGGLCFGTMLGTVLGATGIVCSALVSFTLARKLGGRWLRELLGRRYAWLEGRIEKAGPPVVGLVTAHPTGPMSALFWGAGFSSMALLPFLVAVTAGGSVRALAYAFLGSTLLVPGSPRFYAAAAVLALIALAPFAHPRLRARLLALDHERHAGGVKG